MLLAWLWGRGATFEKTYVTLKFFYNSISIVSPNSNEVVGSPS